MSRCLHRIPFPWGEGIVSRCTCDIPFFISQVGDIVFRCSRGIPFPFGEGHHVPMSPLYRFFQFGGASYFDVRAGILFTLGRVIVFRCSVVFLLRWGGHHILMFPRYPFFRFGGGGIVSRGLPVIYSRLGGEGSGPDISVASLTLRRGGIVSRCLSNIPFPLGGGIGSRLEYSTGLSFLCLFFPS